MNPLIRIGGKRIPLGPEIHYSMIKDHSLHADEIREAVSRYEHQLMTGLSLYQAQTYHIGRLIITVQGRRTHVK